MDLLKTNATQCNGFNIQNIFPFKVIFCFECEFEQKYSLILTAVFSANNILIWKRNEYWDIELLSVSWHVLGVETFVVWAMTSLRRKASFAHQPMQALRKSIRRTRTSERWSRWFTFTHWSYKLAGKRRRNPRVSSWKKTLQQS